MCKTQAMVGIWNGEAQALEHKRRGFVTRNHLEDVLLQRLLVTTPSERRVQYISEPFGVEVAKYDQTKPATKLSSLAEA